MKKMILLFTALISLLGTYSQAVSLDPTFGGKGWTLTDFTKGNTYSEYGRSILVQKDGSSIIAFTIRPYTRLVRLLPDGTIDRHFGQEGFSEAALLYLSCGIQQTDGKIVVAGYVSTISGSDFALARFNLDGTLDSSFGSGGLLHTHFSEGTGIAYSLALQSDGKIVAAGWTGPQSGYNYDMALARYQTDGSPDSTFDTDGKLITDIGGYSDYAFSVVVQPDGKIVAAGRGIAEAGWDFTLVRYNADGSLDNSFGKDGMVATAFTEGLAQAFCLALLPDGKLLAAGSAGDDFALARYTPDGNLDTTFDGDGRVVTDVGASDVVYSIVLQGDEKIVAGGGTYASGNYDYALARYNPDGSVDNSFGNNGKVTTSFEGYDIIYSLALQEDGKILATGMANGPERHDISVARYQPDGVLDASFAGGGTLRVYYPASRSIFYSLAVQPDEKVVVGGTAASDMRDYDYALARYQPEGVPDTTFGLRGKVNTSVGIYDYVNSVAIQSDGKIVVSGYSTDPDDRTSNHIILARYLANGSIDKSFGAEGKVVTGLFGSNLRGCPLALQSDGKIVVGGAAAIGETVDFGLVRYNTDGSPDPGFGQGGKVTTDFFGEYDIVTAIVIQKDGRIVAAGRAEHFYEPYFAVARYNPDGSLDNSFDGDGKVTTSVSGSPLALALQDDGKLVVTSNASKPVLVRYNTDGSLDSSFDGDGKQTLIFESYAYAQSVILQGNRKLVVVGYTYNPLSMNYDVFLARYHEDGSPDESFGVDGKRTASFGRTSFAAAAYLYKNRLYIAGYSTDINQSALLAAYRLDCMDKEICGNRVDDNCDGQVDEGCANTPFLTINDVTVSEDLQRATLMVTLSKKAEEPVQVSYFTVDRTAVSQPNKGQPDYEAKSGTVTIPAGQQTAVISINIFQDSLTEGEEFFDVHLQHPVHAALSGDKARVTIKDGPPFIGGSLLTSVVGKENGKEPSPVQKLYATVQPNPSIHSFTLVIKSSHPAPINFRVVDVAGRLVEAREGVAANSHIQLGQNYRSGVYYLEVQQGSEQVNLKLVKQAY